MDSNQIWTPGWKFTYFINSISIIVSRFKSISRDQIIGVCQNYINRCSLTCCNCSDQFSFGGLFFAVKDDIEFAIVSTALNKNRLWFVIAPWLSRCNDNRYSFGIQVFSIKWSKRLGCGGSVYNYIIQSRGIYFCYYTINWLPKSTSVQRIFISITGVLRRWVFGQF